MTRHRAIDSKIRLSSEDLLTLDIEGEIRRVLKEKSNATGLLARARAGLYNTQKLWDRMPNEPLKWYTRFEEFRKLGPDAVPVDIINLERVDSGRARSRNIPPVWRDYIKNFKWLERRDAYYEWIIELQRRKEFEILEKDLEAEEQEKLAERRARRVMVQAFREKWIDALNAFNPAKDGSARFLVDAFQQILVQGRDEWQDSVEDRKLKNDGQVEEAGTTNIMVNNFTATAGEIDSQLGIVTDEELQRTGRGFTEATFFQDLARIAQESGMFQEVPAPSRMLEVAFPPKEANEHELAVARERQRFLAEIATKGDNPTGEDELASEPDFIDSDDELAPGEYVDDLG